MAAVMTSEQAPWPLPETSGHDPFGRRSGSSSEQEAGASTPSEQEVEEKAPAKQEPAQGEEEGKGSEGPGPPQCAGLAAATTVNHTPASLDPGSSRAPDPPHSITASSSPGHAPHASIPTSGKAAQVEMLALMWQQLDLLGIQASISADYAELMRSLARLSRVKAELKCTGSNHGPSSESLQEAASKKFIRPTWNYSDPTVVNVSFTLYAVLGVNEKTQILTTFIWLRLFWPNVFLTWKPEECGGVRQISLPVADMWTPDMVVYEFIDEDKSQATPYAYVNHSGHVRYDRMIRLVTSCNLGIFNFPFDVQNCTLTFGSYLHTERDVHVGFALPVEQIRQNSLKYLETSGEWELLTIEGHSDLLTIGIDEWGLLKFWVVIRRRPVLYVVNLLIPSAFLMVIDILSFYLPPHTNDRSSFKMTLLLGYTVFLLIMNDLLPSTANGTPLISVYFSVCLALLVLSLVESVIITYILNRGSVYSCSVPSWVRRLVLGFIANVICYHNLTSKPKPPTSDSHVQITANENDGPRPPPPSPLQDKLSNTENKEFLMTVQEMLPPDAMCPGPEWQLALISQNLHRVREMLENQHKEQAQQDEWVQVGYVLDSLLYRLYLIFIGSYAVIIISVWCIWYNI
ncbi:5-hydroxytryptamine receptor 3A-like [Discoglossus pictus]